MRRQRCLQALLSDNVPYEERILFEDPSFLLEAVAINVAALDLAPEALMSDRDFVSKVLEANWRALDCVADEISSDRDIASIAIKQSWQALELATDDLRSDPFFVLEAVKLNWEAIKFAMSEALADLDVQLEATRRCWQAILYIPRWVKIDISVMAEAIRQDWLATYAIIGDTRSEAELVLLAQKNPRILKHHALASIHSVALAAVTENGLVLQYLVPSLRSNQEIVAAAISQNPAAFKHASPELQAMPCLQALAAVPDTQKIISREPDKPHDVDLDLDCDDTESRSSSHSGHSSTLGGHFVSASNLPDLRRLASLVNLAVPAPAIEAVRRPSSRLGKHVSLALELNRKLSASHSRIFSLKPAFYGNRGGKPYFKPCGWARFAIQCNSMRVAHDWCVAYHGTTLVKGMWILAEGLQRPDLSSDVAHGQAYSTTNRTIYVSPSVEYAGHPVYAQLAKAGTCNWLQAVLQVRVRPGSFAERPATLSQKSWPRDLRIDRNFAKPDRLEWLIEDPADVIVTGVLLRELGRGANPKLYGDAAARVTEGESGPEYEWSRLRIEELREHCMVIRPHLIEL